MTQTVPRVELFMEIAAMADRLGATPLNQYMTPWVHNIAPYWTVAVNPTDEAQDFTPKGTMGHKIEPFTADIYFNGWFVGWCSPFDGQLAMMDELCTEQALMEAIKNEHALPLQ